MGRAIKFKDETYVCPYFPIGSIYMNVANINPSTYFGGVWEKIQNAFLFGASNTHPVGETGGEETHVLLEEEVPEHSHGMHLDGYPITGNKSANAGWDNPERTMTFNINDVTSAPKTTTTTGGNNAHNNMPPYLAVYIWKRTA